MRTWPSARRRASASACGVACGPLYHACASQSRISRPRSSRQRVVNDRPGACSTLTQSGNVTGSDSSSRRPPCARSKATTRRPLPSTGAQAYSRSSTARAGRFAPSTSQSRSPVARSTASMPPCALATKPVRPPGSATPHGSNGPAAAAEAVRPTASHANTSRRTACRTLRILAAFPDPPRAGGESVAGSILMIRRRPVKAKRPRPPGSGKER